MKKLVLTAFAALLLPTLALAQGTVIFGSAGPSINNQYFQFENLTKAVGVTAQLWYSPDGSVAYTLLHSLTTEGGAFSGYLFNNAATVVTPTAGGGSAFFRVQGDPALYTGSSGNFQVNNLGNPAGQPPTPAPTLDGWNSPITLVAIPEPSMIALAGLGVASLLLFRRRK